MSKHADFFHGINLYNNDIINFKPHQVSVLPVSPFLGQMVFLDTVDGTHDANQTYQYDGTEWATITHHDLTIANDSADYLEINGHELSIKQLAVGKVTVDETNTTLSDWVTNTSYDGSQMQEGDILILTNATDGQKTYIHKTGSVGDATDFVAMFDELTASEVRGYFTSGEGTTYNVGDGSFDVGHDHSTININGSNELYVVDGGINTNQLANGAVTTVKIADDSVSATKINVDVAGDGLVQNVTTGALDVNVDNSTIKIVEDVISVNPDVVGLNLAGDGLVYDDTNNEIDINVDNSTLEISADEIQVKDAGITEAKLTTAVANKLNDSATATIGNGSATQFTINHTLGTQALIISVADTANDYKEIAWSAIDGKRPTTGSLTCDLGTTVLTSGQYLVTIKKAIN
jgi:hypothetical protein